MLAGITEDWDDRQQFKVVRVETISTKEQAAETSEVDIDIDSMVSNSSEDLIDLESPIEVGQGVAYEILGWLTSSRRMFVRHECERNDMVEFGTKKGFS